MALIGYDPPGKAGKGFAKSMLKLLNSWRDFFIMSRIVSIDVRTVRDADERLGAEIKPTKTGTLVKLVVGGGGGSSTLFAFQTIPAGNDGIQPRVRVILGYVTDMINTPFVPTGMDEGDDDGNPFYVNVSFTGEKIWIKIEFDSDDTSGSFGEITDVTIESGSTVPTPDYAGGLQYIHLATVTVDTVSSPNVVTAVSVVAGGSFAFLACGGSSSIYWSLGLVSSSTG